MTGIVQNLDTADPLPVDPSTSLVICSDVIEHLTHPQLLAANLAALGCPVVLSTPDRERTHGPSNWTPTNPAHAQEWTLAELVAFLGDYGIVPDDAGHTPSYVGDEKLMTSLVTFGVPR